MQYLSWLWEGGRSILENNGIPLYSLSKLINWTGSTKSNEIESLGRKCGMGRQMAVPHPQAVPGCPKERRDSNDLPHRPSLHSESFQTRHGRLEKHARRFHSTRNLSGRAYRVQASVHWLVAGGRQYSES